MNRILNPITALHVGGLLGGTAARGYAGIKYGDQNTSVPGRVGLGALFGPFYPLFGGETDQGYTPGSRFLRSAGWSIGGTVVGMGAGYGAAKMAARFGRRLR